LFDIEPQTHPLVEILQSFARYQELICCDHQQFLWDPQPRCQNTARTAAVLKLSPLHHPVTVKLLAIQA
jgi:hypothetical protein